MLMTKEEYQQFKAKYELMGQLEKERWATEYSDSESFKRLLIFLDEIFLLSLNKEGNPRLSEEKLQNRIMVQNTLNKVEIT